MVATFSPTLFNTILRYHECSNNYEEFKALFKVGMWSGVWKDHRVSDSYIDNLGKCVWNNLNTILSSWENSDGQHSIRIVCWASNGNYITSGIQY